MLAADKYPPFRVDVAVLFGREMVARGHTFDWVLQSEEACERSYRTVWSGGRVWVGRTDSGATLLSRLRKHAYDLLHDLKMFRLARARRYDLIQVKDKFASALLAALAARLSRARFIYWLSYPFPEAWLYYAKEGTARYPALYLLRGRVSRWVLYRVIMRLADHVFVQSEQMRDDVAAMGVDRDKLTAVPMGISLEDFPQPAAAVKNRGAEAARKVVYLGTLVRRRRIDFLIRVMAKVLDVVPQARLQLVGGGDGPSDEEFIREEARRLGVEHAVTITGFLPRDQALKSIEEADLCLSPFRPTPILNSASPTKLVEYMAMAKPVVANDHPEQRLVLAESGGGISVPYQEEAFAQAIVTLLNDPEGAADMGRRGRRYVEQWRTYARLAALVEKEYLRVCAR
jgi:glycosyltransferase involved in cell wall biosynthesis